METILFFAFVGSLFICMALIPPLMKSAGRFQVLDLPGRRKMHHAPVARVGGIAFVAGTFAAVLIWIPKDDIVLSYLIGAAIIFLFGVWDDRANLDFRAKFLAQSAAVAIVVGYGGVRLNTLPFMEGAVFPLWLTAPVTIFVLLGVTNAINLSDGLDGLAGGISLLSFGGIACLAYLAGDGVVLVIAVSVVGGILGFLRFNTYPARVFMGDGGSQFLGFSAGVSALLLTDPLRGPYNPAIGLLVIGLPVLDTLSVMGQRWIEGRSLFLPDKNHIHHKLLDAGFFHHEAVLVIYALQAVMVSLAYGLRWQGDGMVLAVYGTISLAVFALFFLTGRWHWRRPDREHSFSVVAMRRIKSSRWVTERPIQLLRVGVPAFLTLSVFVPRQVPADFGSLALGLFALLLAGLALFRKAAPFLVRVGLYIGGAFVIYLSELAPPSAAWPIRTLLNLFFVSLAVLALFAIRLNREKLFQTTPLDYLVLFAALVVPNLLKMRLGEIALGLLAAKLIVLFFSYELLLNGRSDPTGDPWQAGPKGEERLVPLGLAALWTLLALGVRAWMA